MSLIQKACLYSVFPVKYPFKRVFPEPAPPLTKVVLFFGSPPSLIFNIMRTYQSKFALNNGSIKFYFLCAILITILSSVNAQTTSLTSISGSNEICVNYSVVGTDGVTYDDWFLPSKTELFSIKGQISGPYRYWSSTKINGTENVYRMDSNGTFSGDWKRNRIVVRAIRQF